MLKLLMRLLLNIYLYGIIILSLRRYLYKMINEIDKEFLLSRLKNMNPSDASCLVRLYKVYCLVSKIKEENSENFDEVMDEYDNMFFTIDGTKLSRKKRIYMSLYKIAEKLDEKDESYSMVVKFFRESMEIFKKIQFKNLSTSNGKDENFLMYEYLKERISVMQACLGLNNTFLKSSYNAFIKAYNSLYYSNINSNNDELGYKKNLH